MLAVTEVQPVAALAVVLAVVLVLVVIQLRHPPRHSSSNRMRVVSAPTMSSTWSPLSSLPSTRLVVSRERVLGQSLGQGMGRNLPYTPSLEEEG